MWDNYSDTWDTDFISEGYEDLGVAIRNAELTDGGDYCMPKVVEKITEMTKNGEFYTKKVYNCSNCANLDCPYFYEEYGE